MKNSFLIILFFFFQIVVFAQNNITINSSFTFRDKPIELEESYVSSNNDTLSLETIKVYLSNFELTYKDDTVEKIGNSFFLLDIENSESLKFELKKSCNKKLKSIQFSIGIDSITSVSGALGGCLDATKGMYWAWQSGYINFKIEGKSNSCKTRKNKFQFHIGGYLSPYYSMRRIGLPLNKNKTNYNLTFDLSKLFEKIHLEEFNTVMMPCNEAMNLSDIFQKSVKIK